MDYIFRRCVNRDCTMKDVCYRYMAEEPTEDNPAEVFPFEITKKSCPKMLLDSRKALKAEFYRA